MHSDVRSSRNDVFVLKYWGSLIAAVPAVTLWHDATVIGRLVIVLPFALAAFFLATLVELRIQNGGISYRRFVSWVRVEDGDILATDLAAVPIVGRMSLRRPVLPWGRVYFVLDAPRRRGLFERGEYQLVTALQGRPIPPRPVEPRSSTYRRLGSGLAIGVVAAIVLIAYARRDTVLPPDPTPPSPSGAAS